MEPKGYAPHHTNATVRLLIIGHASQEEPRRSRCARLAQGASWGRRRRASCRRTHCIHFPQGANALPCSARTYRRLGQWARDAAVLDHDSSACALSIKVAVSPDSLQVPKDGSDIPETVIYFEFHSVGCSEMAVDAETFIVSIAEPVSRQRFIHECVQRRSSLCCRLTPFACIN